MMIMKIFSILLPINKYKWLWPRPSDLAFRISAWLTERLHLVDETWRFRPCQEQWCWSITIIVIVNIYFILVIAVSVKITLELVDKGCWKLPMQQNNHLSWRCSRVVQNTHYHCRFLDDVENVKIIMISFLQKSGNPCFLFGEKFLLWWNWDLAERCGQWTHCEILAKKVRTRNWNNLKEIDTFLQMDDG